MKVFPIFRPAHSALAAAATAATAAATAAAAVAIFSSAALLLPNPLSAAEAPPAAWERQSGLAAETDYLLNRVEEPQNHFLLNGQEGFTAGRDFYQSAGDAMPFLWPTHPFLRFGSDRRWQTDSAYLAFEATGATAPGEGPSPFSTVDVSWAAMDDLRLHAGLDQNGLYSQHTLPSRRALVTAEHRGELAWYGGDAPFKSQANVGGAYSRFGTTMAAQFNQGWWWTTSPVSGQPYAWEGFNAELLYHAGEEFSLSLVEQQWDSPSPFQFYKSNWRRSEINMSFKGASAGSWVWRLDIGYERRAMVSEGVFEDFEEKTYPFRFRYRQDWTAPDSLPLRMLSHGNFGYREGMFLAQHGTELRQPLGTHGTHQPMQFIKGYFRYPFKGYTLPTEQLTADSQFISLYRPGKQSRGWVGGAEYREVRKHFLVGIAANYAMEWELPLFQGGVLDTLAGGLIRRHGESRGSDYLLQNATGKVFASGSMTSQGNWRMQAGMRRFWGADADEMEYLPSPWWVLGGAGTAIPTKAGKSRLDLQVAYVGPKEVRGWGPVFEVPEHFEAHLTASQSLFSDQWKLTLVGMHTFGEEFREHPNGNPLQYRLAAGIEGSIE